MDRILFDTSVYGKLVVDEEFLNLIRERYKTHEFIVYGTPLIRKELRATPKTALYGNKKLRILLLSIYDTFITKDNHTLRFNKLVETLSLDYFREYRKNKGSLSHDAIKNDLIIVATATIYHLDIIVSDDERTMLSENAIKSYKSVNQRYGFPNPKFKTYEKFKYEIS